MFDIWTHQTLQRYGLAGLKLHTALSTEVDSFVNRERLPPKPDVTVESLASIFARHGTRPFVCMLCLCEGQPVRPDWSLSKLERPTLKTSCLIGWPSVREKCFVLEFRLKRFEVNIYLHRRTSKKEEENH